MVNQLCYYQAWINGLTNYVLAETISISAITKVRRNISDTNVAEHVNGSI
ncbi:MAG: hypothetical protein ACJASB_001374 [Shewanella psychromarinicola]|jgi:hypothetical protein